MPTLMFEGQVEALWLPDGRHMLIRHQVSFWDSRGDVWTAPAGSIVDGASIPRFFWRVIGSPFSGKYRRASVIHDVYCWLKTAPAADVHRMFREAMLVDGVAPLTAWVMWGAVRAFTRW